MSIPDSAPHIVTLSFSQSEIAMSCDFKSSRIVCRNSWRHAAAYNAWILIFRNALSFNVFCVLVSHKCLSRMPRLTVLRCKIVNLGPLSWLSWLAILTVLPRHLDCLAPETAVLAALRAVKRLLFMQKCALTNVNFNFFRCQDFSSSGTLFGKPELLQDILMCVKHY